MSNAQPEYRHYVVTASLYSKEKMVANLQDMHGVKVWRVSKVKEGGVLRYYVQTPMSYQSSSAIVYGLKRRNIYAPCSPDHRFVR